VAQEGHRAHLAFEAGDGDPRLAAGLEHLDGHVAHRPLRRGVAGAKRARDGDPRGAADLWRPLARDGDLAVGVLRTPMARAFDAAGEPDLANALDGGALETRSRWGGATVSDVTAARRAAARGDFARARALAEVVVRAWRSADRVPPAVAEMRALVERR